MSSTPTPLSSRFVALLLALGVCLAALAPTGAQAQLAASEQTALRHVQAHFKDFGAASKADVQALRVTDRYTSRHNGVTHVYLLQQHNGLDVFGAAATVNIGPDGSVIHGAGGMVAGLAQKAGVASASLTPEGAVAAAARALNLPAPSGLRVERAKGGRDRAVTLTPGGISRASIPARLVYQPDADGRVRLAWEVVINTTTGPDIWNARVDASSGELVARTNYTVSESFGTAPAAAKTDEAGPEARAHEGRAHARDAHARHAVADAPSAEETSVGETSVDETGAAGTTYNVLPYPLESYNHGTRALVNDPADPAASPLGWHDDGTTAYTTTRGNNAFAYEDGNDSDSPSFVPDGGADLVFDFPVDLTQDPNTYEAAAVTNLFFWSNFTHDVLHAYGFDEVAGNFQQSNFGNGGAGGDPVRAEAQDGGGTNNANFSTPPDGGSGRMQMYIWDLTNPRRDGDFDNGIIVHEYGHGLSIRLTGGPSQVSCLSTFSYNEQAGEGWSDWLGAVMTIEPGDTGADRRGIGTYALGQPTTGGGIRDYPYSTDMNTDPRTYADIRSASVPHGVGSVFAAMLWDMTWNLIDRHGFDPDLTGGTGGNNIALQLVLDGMKMQPCGPGFVDARDAILAADQALYGGANADIIWQAFARRGLGFSADQGSSSSVSDGTEAFDLPPQLLFTPDLDVTVTPDPVENGSFLTYTLDVDNVTVNTLTDVTLEATLPGNAVLAYDGGSPFTRTGNTLALNFGTLNSGDTGSASFRVLAQAQQGGSRFVVDDDMETPAGWAATRGVGTSDWQHDNRNPRSGSFAFYAPNVDVVSDQYLTLANAVTLSGQPVLRFWHEYSTETGYDGGVVEISTDGGASWDDLGPQMTQNGYNGTIDGGYGNPLAGRPAFTGTSGGYVQTEVDLTPYSGETVLIRYRLGTDSSVLARGWYVDDVELIEEVAINLRTQLTTNEASDALDAGALALVTAQGDAPTLGTTSRIFVGLAPGDARTDTVGVSNTGVGTLNWAVDATQALPDWLELRQAAGTVAPGAPADKLVLFFDADGLAAGTYTYDLQLASNDFGQPDYTIPVEFVVDTVFPVEMTAFDAARDGRDVVLTWGTASETNNAGFEVQRRSNVVGAPDGFQEAGYVEGNGTTSDPQTYQFRLRDLPIGEHTFRLKQLDFDGASELSDEVNVEIGVEGDVEIVPAYPNPFQGQATFEVAVAEAQPVTIQLYDVMGRRLATLHDGPMDANRTYRFTLSGTGLASGVYFYRVRGANFLRTERATLVR